MFTDECESCGQRVSVVDLANMKIGREVKKICPMCQEWVYRARVASEEQEEAE